MSENKFYKFNETIYESFDDVEEEVIRYAEMTFDDLLDEYGYINVCGLEYAPSRILKAVDSIAYRGALLDYADFLLCEVEEVEEEIEFECEL